MTYRVVVSPRAQQEIEAAVDFYAMKSNSVPQNFLRQIVKAYSALAENPFFEVRYRNIRSLKISKFPYSLYFVINETENTVRVLSCFHNSKNPNKRP